MQTEIPFKLEGNTAPRKQVREIATNSDGLYKISLDQIKIRPGFNKRIKPEGLSEEMWEQILMIPQLADGIYASNGPAEPVLGDFYGPDGQFYITNGERRTRAMNHLIRTERETYPNGEPVNIVRILLNPPETTDIERKRKVITTQDNLKLKPIELAYAYLSFKTEDNMTNEAIGKLMQVSRQTIDNYILATEMPKETQEKVNNGEVSLTTALTEYRAEKAKPKKRKLSVVDEESGEVILTEFQEEHLKQVEKEKDKLRGDEEEFEQQDNSITGTGSKGGPREEGSGSVVIGRDSIYMQEQKKALWKQFVNRYEKLKHDIILSATLENGNLLKIDDMLAERLQNEYNLTVK